MISTSSYLLGEKTCSEWLVAPNLSPEIEKTLQNEYRLSEVLTIELHPETGVLHIKGSRSESLVKLTITQNPQFYGNYELAVLEEVSVSWCPKAIREFKLFRQKSLETDSVLLTYFPTFNLVKLENVNKQLIAYVPEVIVSLE